MIVIVGQLAIIVGHNHEHALEKNAYLAYFRWKKVRMMVSVFWLETIT